MLVWQFVRSRAVEQIIYGLHICIFCYIDIVNMLKIDLVETMHCIAMETLFTMDTVITYGLEFDYSGKVDRFTYGWMIVFT